MRFKGRAIIDPERPRAIAECDRCGFVYNLYTLRPQYEWSGTRLIDKGILVCERCLDEPQPQLRARLIKPDPVPVRNPRPLRNGALSIDEGDGFRVTDATDFRTLPSPSVTVYRDTDEFNDLIAGIDARFTDNDYGRSTDDNQIRISD